VAPRKRATSPPKHSPKRVAATASVAQSRQEAKAARRASGRRPAPQRWAITTVAPVASPQKTVITTKMRSCPSPVAAIAAAPRPPTMKMSTIETSLWNSDDRSTGRERAATSRRMDTRLAPLAGKIRCFKTACSGCPFSGKLEPGARGCDGFVGSDRSRLSDARQAGLLGCLAQRPSSSSMPRAKFFALPEGAMMP